MKQDLTQKNARLSTPKLDVISAKQRRTESNGENRTKRGLYGPEDKMWEVARESSAFFGGGRAVFLQLAHPYVASGVKHHSKAADDIQVNFLFF